MPKTIILETDDDITTGDIICSKINPEYKTMVVALEIREIDENGIVTDYYIRASNGTGDVLYYHPREVMKVSVGV